MGDDGRMGILGAVLCGLGVIGLTVLVLGAGLPVWVLIGVVGLFAVAIAFDVVFDALRR
jgi:hypothetical protein